MIPKYDEDFHAWAMGTAELLRQRRLEEIDFDHLIEEIESMGRSERHELINRLAILVFHLLKWQLQPDFRGRSWHGTIKEQRLRIEEIIEENPSLKAMKEIALVRSYRLACSMIEKETSIDLKLLAQECPYSFEDCLNEGFFPVHQN